LKKIVFLVLVSALFLAVAVATPYDHEYQYFDDAKLSVWIKFPSEVKPGESFLMWITVKAYATKKYALYMCVYDGGAWSEWKTVYKGYIHAGDEQTFVASFTASQDPSIHLIFVWLQVQFASREDYTVIGGNYYYCDENLIFIGPKIRGVDPKELQETIDSLREKYENLLEKYGKLKSAYDRLDEEYRLLKERYENLTRSYKELQESYSELKEKYDELMYTNTMLKVEVENLRRNLTIILAILFTTLAVSLLLAICLRKKVKKLEKSESKS